jgi:small subunit ribosomal protein S16
MSVKIRLARIGKKKAPFFRIVAVDGRKKRDGEYLENLGTYNPLTGELVQFHVERIQAWLDKGAIPSDTVVKLQKQFAKAAKAPVAPKKAASVKKVTKKVEAVEASVIEQTQAAAQE